MQRILLFLGCFLSFYLVNAQDKSKFKQLDEELPTPNVYRTGSGAPGHMYWQQKADYLIYVALDEDKRTITGSETITYTNNSPDVLRYLWVQLDQNLWDKDADSYKIGKQTLREKVDPAELRRFISPIFDGGYKIDAVSDKSGKPLPYFINKTMMRIDLPQPLNPKQVVSFQIKWHYNINNAREVGGRTGYEIFKDNQIIFEIAQWFPRMAVYTDWMGWQHKQFLGQGEYTLPFGDYEVHITVPNDHVVASTGELQNPNAVLTSSQIKRLSDAKKANKPFFIVTPEEAKENQKGKPSGNKTWIFKAKQVRDFAWASSRKFIWDAMGVQIGNRTVMAMSYYPNEANPLWEQYSTESVAHTLRVYSKYTIDYPYPVAISVNGPVGGMEYPMISFNGARPLEDGTYSERTKYGLISVIIHEVGHNFFPMIINSDERQWTWMDEGLNTFVQYLAEVEWDRAYPTRRGPARFIVDYMKGEKAGLEPIMTNSESITQFGNNAYGKPATALNILRETVMGRKLFDFAFKEYARRWAFKHPNPADFFRTMEDASGVDLDWFWRGWFYTTDAVDMAIENVKYFRIPSLNPAIEKEIAKKATQEKNEKEIGFIRNKIDIPKAYIEEKPALLDFYNTYDAFEVSDAEREEAEKLIKSLTEADKALLAEGWHFYELSIKNLGGLLMPLIVEAIFTDGTSQVFRYPVEVWLKNENETSKVIATQKPVSQFVLDPLLETADIDTENNYFPPIVQTSKFQMMKQRSRWWEGNTQNPMQQKNKK